MQFQNKVALVTGGSSGMGHAAAIAFVRHGAKVVVAARREDKGQDAIAQIRDCSGDAHFMNNPTAASCGVS
jgi:NAD(P)-dependent dehydrogenase (short-subunit alcohol dehydrogenase family)